VLFFCLIYSGILVRKKFCGLDASSVILYNNIYCHISAYIVFGAKKCRPRWRRMGGWFQVSLCDDGEFLQLLFAYKRAFGEGSNDHLHEAFIVDMETEGGVVEFFFLDDDEVGAVDEGVV